MLIRFWCLLGSHGWLPWQVHRSDARGVSHRGAGRWHTLHATEAGIYYCQHCGRVRYRVVSL